MKRFLIFGIFLNSLFPLVQQWTLALQELPGPAQDLPRVQNSAAVHQELGRGENPGKPSSALQVREVRLLEGAGQGRESEARKNL